MKFLLTNDDGIDAPGLAQLLESVGRLGQALVVAPDTHLSGCSHQTTTDRPLTLTDRDADRLHVDGTPADCVRLGLVHLDPDVDWVLAGVNDGGNLGVDIFMSGTVAAAREAVLLGKPALAFSQYRRTREPFDWPAVVPLVRRVLDHILAQPAVPRSYWNVNFPDSPNRAESPRIVDCRLDLDHHLPVSYREQAGRLRYSARYQDRNRTPGGDVDICFSGDISVTRIIIGDSNP